MRIKWGHLFLIVLLCTACLLGPVTSVEAAQGPNAVDLKILALNDLHGQLNVSQQIEGQEAGRADYLAAYIKEREKNHKHVWKVHQGDMVGASAPISSLLQDEPTIEVLNKLKFDVGTVGNHEFDEGVDEMFRLIYGGTHEKTGYFKGANFPYTVANVVWKDSGKTILPSHHIKRVQGIPVGFIGVVTKSTPSIVMPEGVKDVEFLDETESINREVKKLKKKGVKAIIVLAHEGGTQNTATGEMTGPIVDIAKGVDEEVDLILAGHSHRYLNGTVDGKLIVQAYSSGTAFAEVDLKLDKRTRDITHKEAEVVTTFHSGMKPDRRIARMVAKYEEIVAPIINEEIAQAGQTISREPNEAGESALGNLVADAQRQRMDTDFAFMNPGGIRADIREGTVTWGDLYNVQPFGNELVTMTLTGDQIKRLLEQQWQDGRTRFLQISGLTYTWDPSRSHGDRVLDIRKADGTVVEADTAYTVTANRFIATGGDGFTVFTEATDQVVGPVDLQALIDYIRQLPQPFSYEIEGRITRINPS
ncbi:bifunctional metallophosphatase/5'-nucleotidase [Desmospora profundinema]|uniref:5'-nucleotidase n=1 Tax=Desmospora profundinema TaxID=1571184 RepID=A0ABU1IMJ7_9BACL|nr:5'-nucleotidase C-terminal domain-containing protein [Desmospora profundinema]MDR6225921.1 5'-nucleotidase [Desmospora profundinema]